MTPVSSITRQATRGEYDKLNVLTAPTHEAYETGLAATGFDYYSIPHESFKTWNTKYRPVPSNYHLMKNFVPHDVDIDVVLSQNKFGQFQVLGQVANQFCLPMISLEHTLPMPQWDAGIRQQMQMMRGHLNVFISEYSVKEWGFDIDDPAVRIVHHGIDTNTFYPSDVERKNEVLCVVNDWINRDWCCNFNGFVRTASHLKCRVLGDTPGLSKPAGSLDELVSAYQQARIFYNTSTISPVPTALMEAMACGCAVVSTATCMIPEIIEHGYNGLISNDEDELRSYLDELTANPNLAVELGKNARTTIQKLYSLDQFVWNWDKVLREGAEFNACR